MRERIASHGRSAERESETPVLALPRRNHGQRPAGHESATNDWKAINEGAASQSAIKVVTPAIEISWTDISISVQLKNKVRRSKGDA
jgi:hypothetical protein